VQLDIGLAKVGKYAVGDSGDSVEIVERPRGGLSVVIVDGQGHGRPAKRLSHQVASKAATLIGDGARDGVAMRSINDFLYALRDGRVSCTVTILTLDLEAQSLVVSRNSNCPVVIGHSDGSHCLDSEQTPIGVHRENRPAISHWPIYPGTTAIGFTDGVIHAGRYGSGDPFSLGSVYQQLSNDVFRSQTAADAILEEALAAERYRPNDDMVVAVLHVSEADKGLGIRRMCVTYPF